MPEHGHSFSLELRPSGMRANRERPHRPLVHPRPSRPTPSPLTSAVTSSTDTNLACIRNAHLFELAGHTFVRGATRARQPNVEDKWDAEGVAPPLAHIGM